MSTSQGLNLVQFLFLAVRQRRHHMKASFSQSEEVFSRSHIAMSDNILQLQARVAERDDEIGKLKGQSYDTEPFNYSIA